MSEGQDARPTLVERSAELAVITASLHSARRGVGTAVGIAGPAGMGKSSLLAHARTAAEDHGMLVVSVGATQLDTQLPVELLACMVRAGTARMEPELRQATLDAPGGAIARLLRAGDGEPGAMDFSALAHALYWWLNDLSAVAPTLIVLDDLQWADAASVRLLASLIRTLDGLPVSMVLSVRTGVEPSDELALRVLLGLCHDVCTLAPLTRAGVNALTEGLPEPDHLAERVLTLTRGNPLLVSELVRLARRGDELPDGLDPTQLDGELIRLVGRRLVAVEWVAGRAAVAAVALLGGDADELGVVRVLGQTRGDAGTLVDELLSAEILLRVGDRLEVNHPLVASTVLASLPVVSRQAMHAAVATELVERGVPAQRIALHLMAARVGAVRGAYALLRSAALAVWDRGHPRAALPFLTRALAEATSDEERAVVLEHTLRLSLDLRDSSVALRHLDDVAALSGSGRVDAERALMEALSVFEGADSVSLASPLSLTSTALPDLQEEMRGRLMLQAACSMDAEDGLAPVRATLVAGGGASRVPAHAAALAHELFSTPGATAQQVHAAARQALDGTTTLATYGPAALVPWVAIHALLHADALDEARELIEQGLSLAASSRSPAGFAAMSLLRSQFHWYSGNVDDAAADAEAALTSHEFDASPFEPAARSQLALAVAARGDIAAAQRLVEPLLQDQQVTTLRSSGVLDAVGRVLTAARRLDEAESCFQRLAAFAGKRSPSGNPSMFAWRSGLASVYVLTDRREAAAELAAAEVTAAREFGAARPLGRALRVLGVARGLDGLGPLTEAVELLSHSPARLERSAAELERGILLIALGREVEAQVQLRHAHELSVQLGVKHLADRVEAVFAELRPGGASPEQRLTPGESRVVRLAARGLTNRQIAEQLFVTRKAVEWHLHHAYAKLGVSSRQDLIAVTPVLPSF